MAGPKDELDGDDVREHRRTRWIAAIAASAILTFGIGAAAEAYRANLASQEATRQKLAAEKSAMEARRQQGLADERRKEAEDRLRRLCGQNAAALKWAEENAGPGVYDIRSMLYEFSQGCVGR